MCSLVKLNMPPSRFPLLAHRVRKFIHEYPDLRYNGSEVICVVCKKKLLCWKRAMCNQHINTASHQNKLRGENVYVELMCDLILMLSACNIPFHVVRKEPFREFWKKYIPQWKLPSSETLRLYLPHVRDRIEKQIKQHVRNKKLWITVDETTDSQRHSVATVVVRVLNKNSYSPPFLLACKRLQQCTGETIKELVKTTLQQFEISAGQVLMLVTDGAAYMRLAGRLLQQSVYPQLTHVTCILHTLHLVADTVRKCYPQVDKLIAETKAVFTKSPKRIREFHNMCTGIPEPPQPVLTRWGTWINAAFYYVQHFDSIKNVVLKFNSREAECIKKSQEQFQNQQVYEDLQIIRDNYTVLGDAIKQFQNTSLSFVESVRLIDQLQTKLQTLSDTIGITVKEKMETLLSKNPGLARLRNLYNNPVPEDLLTEFKEYFAHAPITSIDVERSFSLYKNIFTPRRTSFQERTVETHLMLQMFHSASASKCINPTR